MPKRVKENFHVNELKGGRALQPCFAHLNIYMVAVALLGCARIDLATGQKSGKTTATPAPSQSSPTGGSAAPTSGTPTAPNDGDTASEPVSIGGAFLACISANNAAASGVDIYCGLKKSTDHTLIKLPSDAAVGRAALLQSNNISVALRALKSPDAAWHWLFAAVTAKLADYTLLAVEVKSSNIAAGILQGYFINPRAINNTTPTDSSANGGMAVYGSPLVYQPWAAGEPSNNYQGTPENCGNIYDYNYSDKSQPGTYGWNDYDCSQVLPFACQNITAPLSWTISGTSGAWGESAGKCALGYQFSIPHNDAENAALMALIQATFPRDGNQHSLWLNAKKVADYVNYFIIP